MDRERERMDGGREREWTGRPVGERCGANGAQVCVRMGSHTLEPHPNPMGLKCVVCTCCGKGAAPSHAVRGMLPHVLKTKGHCSRHGERAHSKGEGQGKGKG